MQFSGAFWATLQRFNMNSHAIDQILNREDAKLEDVLNEDTVVQEVRNQNQKLYEFLDESKLEGLIDLITVFPDEDAGQKRTQNHPFIACEILSESGQIHDKISENPQLLEKLFSFLHKESLHPTLLGYFSKAVQALLSRAFEKTILYLSSTGTHYLINHIRHRSILDILCKILQSDSLGKEEIFSTQKQILSQVFEKLLNGGEWESVHSALLLSDLISKITDFPFGKDLVQGIVEENNIRQLFELLGSDLKYKIIAAASVIKTLYIVNFRVDLISLYPWFNLSEYFVQVVEVLEAKLENVVEDRVENTIKQEVVPLGEARLKIVEIIALALKNAKENVCEKVAVSGIPNVLIRLFFEYPWHSMLHSTFDNLVLNALQSSHEKLIRSFFCNKAFFEAIFVFARQESRHRLGNLGYIHKFANYLKDSSDPFIHEFLSSNPEWANFTAGYLKKRNKLDKKQLGQNSRVEDSSSRSDIKSEGKIVNDKENQGGEVNNEENVTDFSISKVIEDKIDEESKNETMPEPTSPPRNSVERKMSDGLGFSPKSSPEFNHVNFWGIDLKVDEIEDLD